VERAPKTWGPFSGRQLTTMVCVIAAVVLLPVGAWAAVSFTNVSITDPGGVNRAKVDTTGKLAVGDGVGPLTIDGSVGASLPTKPIAIPVTFVGSASVATHLYGPQTLRFGLTSLTVSNSNGSNGATFLLQTAQSNGIKTSLFTAFLAPASTSHFVFPTALVAAPPAGGTVSIVAFGVGLEVSAVGVQS
jgi:hypothetical protein